MDPTEKIRATAARIEMALLEGRLPAAKDVEFVLETAGALLDDSALVRALADVSAAYDRARKQARVRTS